MKEVLASVTDFLEELGKNKDAFEALKAPTTIGAILMAGFWTYLLFVRKRERYPRAKFEHKISSWKLPNGEVLLRVTVHIENAGGVLLRLKDGFTWLQQITPLTPEISDQLQAGTGILNEGETETRWPTIGNLDHTSKVEIEPGESDDVNLEFLVPPDVERVLIYTHFDNLAKRGWWNRRKTGWNVSTLYQIADGQPVGTTKTQQSMSENKATGNQGAPHKKDYITEQAEPKPRPSSVSRKQIQGQPKPRPTPVNPRPGSR
jgi:hypothetical protein